MISPLPLRGLAAALMLMCASGVSASPHPWADASNDTHISGGQLSLETLPARGRAVLVDAASATLFMIEDGRVRDSMRVIVGKPTAATPTLRSTLYYATFNPYWYVPADLARTAIAPRVLKEGMPYLRQRGYQVISGFTENPSVLQPETVDWKAVAAGRATVHIRQLPGPTNSMGQMKFSLYNSDGVLLHDTPKKELFAEADRSVSNGCVRLEDAARLAHWLLGREPVPDAAVPEAHMLLPRPVPVVITYLDEGAQTQLAALR